MPVTLNMGMKMPSWFDLYDLGNGKKYDEEGLLRATKESELCVCDEEGLLRATKES